MRKAVGKVPREGCVARSSQIKSNCPRMASSVDQVFELITKNVAADPGLVKRVGGVYHFDIDGKVWTVDLKNGNGSVKSGKDGKADCTITIKGDDFLSLASGTVRIYRI